MKEINSTSKWHELLDHSDENPCIVLKHSNTCPISTRAYDIVSQSDEAGDFSLPVYLVVVQESRDVSHQIATDLDVKHESPQILIVQNKQCTYHASHYDIDDQTIKDVIAEI